MSETASLQSEIERVSQSIPDLEPESLIIQNTIFDGVDDEVITTPEDDVYISDNDKVKENITTNTKKLPVVYGRGVLVKGVTVFTGVSGTSNEYLHLVSVFCEGEISAFNTVYINDIATSDSYYSGLITKTEYKGESGQAADTDLINAFGGIGWTSNHRLRGIAYTHLKILYDEEKFKRFPVVTADINGRWYDDGGTPRWTPSWLVYDYLTNATYGAGLSIPSTNFDHADDRLAQDTSVTDNTTDSGTIDEYSINAIIKTENTLLKNLKEMCQAFFGGVTYQNGEYVPWIGTNNNRTITSTIDEDDILMNSIKISQPSRRSRYNGVKVAFVNKDKDSKSYIYTNVVSSYVTEDGGLENIKEVSLKTDNDPDRVKRWAEVYLKKSRQGLMFECMLTPKWLYAEIGRIYQITHATPAWTNKQFQLVKLTVSNDLSVSAVFIEWNSSTYDSTTPGKEEAQPDTSLPDPYSVSNPLITSVTSGTSDLLQAGDGSIVSRINLQWSQPADQFISHYEIQFRKNGDATYLSSAPAVGATTTQAYITGIEDGATYSVRVRAVNNFRAVSDWDTASHVVVGKTQAPSDVTTFQVSEQADRTRVYEWTHTAPDIDLAGYRVKYHATASTAWASMTLLHPVGLLTFSPWENNLLTAGTYDFAIKAVDTSGNESTNEKRVRVTISDPREGAAFLVVNAHVEGWPGTLTDCFISGAILEADLTQTWDGLTTWDAYNEWTGSGASGMTYEHDPVNLGSSTTFKLDPSSDYNGDAVTFSEAHSTDGVSYSSFATINPATEITAQYVKLKINVTKSSGSAATISTFKTSFITV